MQVEKVRRARAVEGVTRGVWSYVACFGAANGAGAGVGLPVTGCVA